MAPGYFFKEANMIKVNNVQLDFDITSPSDILRYKQAGERMEAEGVNLSLPTLSPDDPAFLLGNNPSLNKVAEINDALGDALEVQGKEFGVKLQKYKPNRATRRAQK